MRPTPGRRPPGEPTAEGPALLQGIVTCGRCGKRMTVRYYSRGGATVPNYLCQRTGIEEGTSPCACLVGADVDTAVGVLLISSVTPLALEVALAVQEELEDVPLRLTPSGTRPSSVPGTALRRPGAVTCRSTPITG